MSQGDANRVILSEIHEFLINKPNYSFGQALHEMGIMRVIKAGDTVIGCEPLAEEPSLETLKRIYRYERVTR